MFFLEFLDSSPDMDFIFVVVVSDTFYSKCLLYFIRVCVIIFVFFYVAV